VRFDVFLIIYNGTILREELFLCTMKIVGSCIDVNKRYCQK